MTRGYCNDEINTSESICVNCVTLAFVCERDSFCALLRATVHENYSLPKHLEDKLGLSALISLLLPDNVVKPVYSLTVDSLTLPASVCGWRILTLVVFACD